ncbi:hypothetical protein [Achromobacter xylosoxidans]|uniref:hypothetical protein n=1 Tax=Alcaligenes xylosoxydans xylosoxydans TaxID=85698 RepID=UPI0006690627|nr:hypothetical protein [Achromobacter xylosoxidans]MCH4571916.1 hypothetical protein [Achromobacter xylosoxidans]MDD7988130.1 hypothetical protein [Achromobacter xylosoxidans]NEV03825.1 hypothetical protein [Achromobacter xylosoxidans]OFO60968.1 hypothetical protein HMPREF3024_24480 [Achromobacter xylosoxidans]OMG81382.1 hypothetical protein BIZ53_29330 [Achromobacter xylosoxidans]
MEVTQTVSAWLTPTSLTSPDEITDPNKVRLGDLSYTNLDMTECGYTLIGKARITLALPDRERLIDSKVASMRAEVKKIRAEAEAKACHIENQISNLLAIELSPAPASESDRTEGN